MKTRCFIITAVLAVATLARADYTPIAINPSSFNKDPVIEAAAPKTMSDAVNATMDGGTNKTGNTWFEVGYITNSVPVTNGLPVHNSTVTANNHTYIMPPDYHTNCVIMVGKGAGGGTPVQRTGRLTLTTPAAFSSLSFLNASGNGPVTVGYVVNYADTTTESNIFVSLDWFNAATRVYNCAGRVSVGGGIQNLNGVPAGALFGADVPLGTPGVNVTSVDFYYVDSNGNTNNNGRANIFAIAGSADNINWSPVPVSGFNFDTVIEADGPKTTGTGNPDPITGTTPWGVLTNDNTYINFTMDGGTSKQQFTWFERGYYASLPTTCGIPAAGSTITSATEPTIHYTMPSTYVGNCAVCLASNSPTANILFQTPTAAGGLSFLLGDGNGTLNVRAEVQFQDGTTETNWIAPVDWFNRTDPWAYVSFGHIRPALRNLGVPPNGPAPDQFPNAFYNFVPFIRDPRLNSGGLNPSVPNIRLFDVLLPIVNSSGLITNVALVTTNVPNFTTTIAIFAVSGSPGSAPQITQPVSLNTDPNTGATNLTVGAAVANDIRLIKGFQGTHFSLWVSNRLNGVPVSYQWKKAPRGGGWRDIFDSFDMATFANVSGPNIGGATSNFLTISNANISDSGDYLVLASNPYGFMTSFVATVMVMTTNGSVLVGQANGDTITKYTADTDSATAAEFFGAASDQVAQKWLSRGNLVGVLPFAGPAGYVVNVVSGASFVTAIRFYCANDGQQRDPRDYSLEGSNDGTTWTTITGGQLLGTLMLPVGRGGTGPTVLNPMTQPVIEVNFPNANSYKSYRVTITNNIEPNVNTLMQIAEIQLLGTFVPAPPTWVRQPEPAVTVFVGTSPSFSAKASGLGALAPKYLWFRNGSAISGATASSYTLANAQLGDSGSTFFVVATNNFGAITSTVANLTVITAPTQPYPVAVLGNSPRAYWRLNEPDNGSGNNGVVAHDYAGGHNGYYSNTVNGVFGYNPTADPDTAMQLSTVDQLVAGINDVDFGRAANTPGATFSVEAWAFGGNQTVDAAVVAKGYNGNLNPGTGTGTEQYAIDVTGGNPRKFRFLVRGANGQGFQALSQVNPYDIYSLQPTWHHIVGVCDQPNGAVYIYVDGTLAASGSIPPNAGIIAQALPTTIGSRQSNPTADYDNEWGGSIDDVAIYGAALSPSQILAHYYAAQKPPVISVQPTNQTTPENIVVTFYTAAYGPGTLGYQWYNSDGSSPTTAIGGQTSPNLSFTTLSSQSGNFYQLVVTNNYGSTTSLVARLDVVSGVPQFTQDIPASQTLLIGHVIQLQVNVLGTAPFSYQWKKDGVDIVDNFRISGAHTNQLTIGYATNADSGNYQVIVSNGEGSTPSAVDAILVTNVNGQFVQPMTTARTGWNYQLTGTGAGLGGMSNGAVTLTVNLGNTVGTCFLSNKVDVTSFVASFVYNDATGVNGADGITFCLHNDPRGAAAAGGGGGGLGYSAITPSVALAMNIYAPNTRGINLLTNGVLPVAGAGGFAPILPVDLGGNNDPIQVTIVYYGGNLSASFRDLVTSATYTTNLPINIPAIVGANTAFAGFTGADGGVFSTQVVSNFLMGATSFKLNSQQLGNSLIFTWPATAGAFFKGTPALGNPSIWTLSTSPFQVISNQATVTVSPLLGNQFYRLEIYP